MKLVISIIRDLDSGPVVDELVGRGFRVTRVASTGGFLRRGRVTLLIGVEQEQVDEVINVFRETCAPPDPGQNRAVVFVVDAPYFEQV
jgi:uncharacterized protein YaaQ